MSTAGPALGRDDLAELLGALGCPSPLAVTPVSGGVDSLIWRVETPGGAFALRLLHADQVDQSVRERRAAAIAALSGVKTPAIVSSASWRGRPAMLMEWAAGHPLAEALLSDAENDDRPRRLGESFGRVQAAIHDIAPPVDLRADWLDWPESKPDLRHCFETVTLRPSVLLHLDFHPLNVLVDDDGKLTTLDWANAHAGDPRADLARTQSIIELAPVPPGIDRDALEIAVASFLEGWRSGYQDVGGSFEGLAPFCWWAGAAMEQELSSRFGQPGFAWMKVVHLKRARDWTAKWRLLSLKSA